MKRIISVFAIIAIIVTIIVTLFTGCQYSFDTDFGGSIGNTDETGETTMSASDLKELSVNVGVGVVTISRSSNENAEIIYTKNIRGDSEHVKEVLDSIQVVTEAVGDKLVVEVKANNEDSEDFWQWVSKKYKNINMSVDIDIRVPDNMDIIDINVGVGDILINDLRGRYKLASGVGKVKLKDVSFRDKSDVTTGTGNIEVDCEINDAISLSVQSGVGDVVILMPEDTGFDLDAVAGVGSIKGNLITPNKDSFVGGALKQKVNGGGIDLEVTSGTGSITVNKK